MLCESIISNLRYAASTRENGLLNHKKLEDYLRIALRDNDSSLIVKDTDSIRVLNVRRLGGGLINDVYSFLLVYAERSERRQLNLVIKIYRENVDRIFDLYIHDQDLRMCVRAYDALRSLERVSFPVAKAYFYECDSRFIGYPFLIMSKLEKSQESNKDYLDRFAAVLANLHNLEIGLLKPNVLIPPKDGYAFASRWPLHFKHALNLETKHNSRLRRSFDRAILWLEENISDNFCSRYSLIHGDAHPTNVFLTNDSQIALIDWESVNIGDPAYDVGNAYNQIKFFSNPKNPDSGDQNAERFISKYSQVFKGDIRPRLEFYRVVSFLGAGIPYSSTFSSPLKAIKYYKRKVLRSIPFLKLPLILLAFPFLRWLFVARQLRLERGLYWLRYFENFMEELI